MCLSVCLCQLRISSKFIKKYQFDQNKDFRTTTFLLYFPWSITIFKEMCLGTCGIFHTSASFSLNHQWIFRFLLQTPKFTSLFQPQVVKRRFDKNDHLNHLNQKELTVKPFKTTPVFQRLMSPLNLNRVDIMVWRRWNEFHARNLVVLHRRWTTWSCHAKQRRKPRLNFQGKETFNDQLASNYGNMYLFQKKQLIYIDCFMIFKKLRGSCEAILWRVGTQWPGIS